MNLNLPLLISNALGIPGSWPQLASEFWRFSLSMNRGDKRPSSPQPSPPSGEEREKSAMGGSWSQYAKNGVGASHEP